jgi:hypothetical protein
MAFFNQKFSDINFVCFLTFLMAVGRSRSKATLVPVTPEQSQEVAHEEEQVISAVEKLTQQTSVPGILQEEAGA